jgi:hypothetical protein
MCSSRYFYVQDILVVWICLTMTLLCSAVLTELSPLLPVLEACYRGSLQESAVACLAIAVHASKPDTLIQSVERSCQIFKLEKCIASFTY